MPIRGRLSKILSALLQEQARYGLAWLLLIVIGGIAFYHAWSNFDIARELFPGARRRGGNAGHTLIDFGGQWLIGAMAAHGKGQQLYHRAVQHELLQEAYPEEEEVPPEDWKGEGPYEHEADRLMGWFVAVENPRAAKATAAFVAPFASQNILGFLSISEELLVRNQQLQWEAAIPEIGGPLYPPVHALLMYPLGSLSPARAYRIVQIAGMAMALLSGWGICRLSHGRIWWPIATTGVILFPGFISSLILGQNSIFMLTLLICGWVLVSVGRPLSAGLVWGVLAFKPVWLVAFFLVPLLTRKWRFCLGMLAVSAALAIVSLPLVGWHCWLEWFEIGREASKLYGTDQNWVLLSRDLLNIPRRWLFDFQSTPSPAAVLAADLIGFSLLVAAFECTVRFALLRKEQVMAATGPAAAFMLLGAWFCCYHFMYYDMLLTALPVFLLLLEPLRFVEPKLLLLQDSPGQGLQIDKPEYYRPRWATVYPALMSYGKENPARVFVLNSMTLSLILLFVLSENVLTGLSISVSVSAAHLNSDWIPLPVKFTTNVAGTPWGVFSLFALWLWCGWLSVRQNP
jgi:hypothetical protein